MKYLRKRQIPTTIFVTYAITFILPLTILLSYLFPRLTAVMEERSKDAILTEITILAQNFENELNAIYNYSTALNRNSSLTADVLATDNPINRSIICSELSQTLSPSPYASVSLLYSKTFDRYYSPSASYKAQWIHSNSSPLLSFDATNIEAYLEALCFANQLTILPQQTISINGFPEECIIVIMPISPTPLSMVLIIPTDTICLAESEETILLLDVNDNVLAGDFCPANERLFSLAEYTGSINGNSNLIKINGTEYLLYQQNLKFGDLRIASLHTRSSILQDVDSLSTNTLIIVSLLFLAGSILILAGMHVSYFPLRKIQKEVIYMDSSLHDLSIQTNLNDWDIISYALKNLSNQNNITQEKLHVLQTISQNLFLYRYLFGGIHDESYIIEMAEIYNIDIRDQLVCIAFACSAKNKHETLLNITENFCALNTKDDKVSCYFIDGTYPSDLLLILFFNAESDLEPYSQQLYQMNADVKIGIGSCESIQNPERSRAMSLSALDAALFDDTLTVAQCDDISLRNVRFLGKVFDQIELYEKAISRGKTSQMNSLFDPLLNMIFSESKRLYTIQIIYTNLYNVLAHHLGSYNCHYIPIYSPFDMPENLDEMRQTLNTMHTHLVSLLESHTNDEKIGTDIHQILDYINENFSDTNITLLSVAEKFGYSYSNFSHFFRKNAGQTFSSYLERVRINEAKRLLDETDDVLNIIASKVGFTNVNTFTRSFKKLEIITPGSYRSRTE